MQQLYYCPECGNKFEREIDEHICKGCSMLPKEIFEFMGKPCGKCTEIVRKSSSGTKKIWDYHC